MSKRKIAKGAVHTPAQLDKLIEEAIVDCYDEEEQASGCFTMIEDNFALPFVTWILGVEVSVVAVKMDATVKTRRSKESKLDADPGSNLNAD